MANDNDTLQLVLRDQAAMKQSLNNLTERLDDQKTLTESVHKLALSSVEMAGKITNLTDKVAKIDRDVEEVKCKPAKKWDRLGDIVVGALVGGVATYIFASIGLR